MCIHTIFALLRSRQHSPPAAMSPKYKLHDTNNMDTRSVCGISLWVSISRDSGPFKFFALGHRQLEGFYRTAGARAVRCLQHLRVDYDSATFCEAKVRLRHRLLHSCGVGARTFEPSVRRSERVAITQGVQRRRRSSLSLRVRCRHRPAPPVTHI